MHLSAHACFFRTRHALAIRLLAAVGLVALSPAWALAQSATALAVDREVTGSLAEGGADSYTVDLGEGYFVYGTADQKTVDVVVTIYNDEGEIVGKFDGPPRGYEPFQFESKAAGTYRIEIAPFEDQTGEYTLRLRRAEPIASTPEARVDQLMVAYDDPRTPGGVIAVVKDGELAFAKAYGSANLTFGIPFEIDTRTNIGSTTKQFTAYAILLLAEQGKLDLDDDIREYIPELPDFGETVTVRHLLTHTSGYREFLNTLAMSGRRLDRGDSIDRDELIAVVQHQPALQNSPGAEWNYNNTAFGLLATTVERISDETFAGWMAANVFHPLGMNDTFVRKNPAELIERRAEGYAPTEDGGYQIARDLGGSTGAGGIYTTIPDLAKWVRNYRTGELGSPAIFEQMSTPYVLTNGKPTGYGFGLFIDELRGLKRIQHGGADTAHRSMVMYFPELDAAVITQSNNATFLGTISDAVATAFFEDSMEPLPDGDDQAQVDSADEEFDPTTFDAESFDALAGRFELEEAPGFVLRFWRDGDTLMGQATGQPEFEIVPIATNRFKITVVDASITFNLGDTGTAESIMLHQNGDHPGKRLEDEAWAPDADALAAYTGRYFSEELETFYTIALEDDHLVIQHRRFDDVKLTPNTEREFTGGFPVATVAFETDETGHATAFIAGNGRARDIRFERVE